MNKKPMGSRAATVSAETTTRADVEASLELGSTRLDAAEEKVLRMLHGVPAPRTLVLQRVGQEHPDSREKLLGLEQELLRQWRERERTAAPSTTAARAGASADSPVSTPVAAAPVNPRRDKIVAALRARKSRH